MRRENLVIAALALPSVNALSLANFQQITSLVVPQACKVTYDSQIPSCTVSDFQIGCSETCQLGLKFVESGIITSCTGVEVSPNALLAVIIRGSIIPALCPILLQVPTTIPTTSSRGDGQTTIRPSIVSSSTSPPKSPESTESLTSKTTKAKPSPSTSIVTPPSQASSTQVPVTSDVTESSSTSSAPTETLPVSSADPTQSSTLLTATKSRSAGGAVVQSSSPTAAPTKVNSGNSGGGSPFDIDSSGNHLSRNSLVFPLLICLWAGIMFGQ